MTAACVCGHIHETVTLDGTTSVFHRCRAAECECNEFRAPPKPFERSKAWWVARARAEENTP